MTTSIQRDDYLITPTYEGKRLSFLEKKTPDSLDQKEHPIVISLSEMKAMSFPIVLKVLSGESQFPSSVTKINYEQMKSPLIEKIDHMYQEAMKEYERDFGTACDKDTESIKTVDQEVESRIDKIDYTTRYFWRGLLLPPLIGMIPGYFYGKQLDLNKEEKNAIIRKEAQREQSTHRRAELQKIDGLERKRHREIEIMIHLRIKTLLKTIKELEEVKECDPILQKEMYYLFLIYKDIFSNKLPLVLCETDIGQYLKEKGIDESTSIELKV